MSDLEDVLEIEKEKEARFTEVVNLMQNLKEVVKKKCGRTLSVEKGFAYNNTDSWGVSLGHDDGDRLCWFTEWRLLWHFLPWKKSDMLSIQVTKDLRLKVRVADKMIAEAVHAEIVEGAGKIKIEWLLNFT